MNNLQKFRSRRNKYFVGILIFLFFSESGIQYLWEGEINVCKILVPIKVVPVKNDYFLHPKFELHSFQQINRFLYWSSFYWKIYISHKLYCPAKTNLDFIRSTYSKSNLAIESPAILVLLTLSVWSSTTTWKNLARERCFDVIVFTLNK